MYPALLKVMETISLTITESSTMRTLGSNLARDRDFSGCFGCVTSSSLIVLSPAETDTLGALLLLASRISPSSIRWAASSRSFSVYGLMK